MLGCIASLIVLVTFVHAQGSEVAIPDNKAQCLEKMLQWCKDMQYPEQGVGMTMLSIQYEDPKGFYRVYCTSDNNGTVCNRNGLPWFSCSPNNSFSYKGVPVDSNTAEVDDEICPTADKAFNDIFVQNLSYNTTSFTNEFEKGMESFFEQIALMQEQIERLQKRLTDNPFWNQNFWTGFEDGFFLRGLLGNPKGSNETDDTSTNPTNTEASNQIEKE